MNTTRIRRMIKKKLFFLFILLITTAFIYKTLFETTISDKNE
jgi:hypothetical protein